MRNVLGDARTEFWAPPDGRLRAGADRGQEESNRPTSLWLIGLGVLTADSARAGRRESGAKNGVVTDRALQHLWSAAIRRGVRNAPGPKPQSAGGTAAGAVDNAFGGIFRRWLSTARGRHPHDKAVVSGRPDFDLKLVSWGCGQGLRKEGSC